MPMDKEQKSELKALINVAKKRELNFGLCLGKTSDATLLLTHKTKGPEILGKQARKEGETTKVAFGVASCKSTTITFRCLEDPPSGLARKMREYFKSADLNLKVVIDLADGTTVEEDGGEDETPESEAAAPPSQPIRGYQEKIRKAFDLLKPKLKQLLEAAPDNRAELQALIKQVQQGDESEAAAALKQLSSLAASAPKDGAAGELSIVKLGKARIEWISVRREGLAGVEQLKKDIMSVYVDAPTAKKAVSESLAKLQGAVSKLDATLENHLDAVLNEADPNRRKGLAKRVSETVRKFSDLCENDPILKEIDGNEFNKNTRIIAPIRNKLSDIQKALGE